MVPCSQSRAAGIGYALRCLHGATERWVEDLARPCSNGMGNPIQSHARTEARSGVTIGCGLNILHVIPSIGLEDGGPSVAIRMMERALVSAGADVTVVTTVDNCISTPTIIRGDNNGRPIRHLHYFRRWTNFYKVAPGIVPYLWTRMGSFDVVHIHALFSFTSVVAAAIAAIKGVPYVVRPLGTLQDYGVQTRRYWLKQLSLAFLEGPLLRAAAAVHFTSKREQSEARSVKVPMQGVVIPLGIEPIVPGDAELFLRTHPHLCGRRLLLYLSRIDRKKNLEGLLKAFAVVRSTRPDVTLLIAGAGEPLYTQTLRGLAIDLGLTSATDVVWVGHVQGAEKAAVLAAAEIFVLASYSENFGIAVVEALSAGLPCIISNDIAIAEEIVRGGGGIAVATEPQLIASSISRLLDDDRERAAMSAKARQVAAEKFSSRVMAEALIDLYSSIRSKPPTCQSGTVRANRSTNGG